jgi:hypothetical protein
MKITIQVTAANPGEAHTFSQVLEVSGAFTEAGHPLPEVRAAAHRFTASSPTARA